MSILKKENTQEGAVKHTFIMPINTELMQGIESHRPKQRAGVEDTGSVNSVAFGEKRRIEQK